jgi:hypothetical protein
MVQSTGWVLDISIETNRAIIWIKTIEGSILRLVDAYQPNFYILPKDEYEGSALFHILSHESLVKKVGWEPLESRTEETNFCQSRIHIFL